jgi:3-isopropylmalate dehydrogenase
MISAASAICAPAKRCRIPPSRNFRKHDAMFLGAIGHPDVKPGILETGILLKTRFALDQYINLRPVKLYRTEDCPLKDKEPKDVDFVVVRENTGGIYTGVGGVVQKGTPMEIATQVMVYGRPVVDRCVKFAYELTRKRNKQEDADPGPQVQRADPRGRLCGCARTRKWATSTIRTSSRTTTMWMPARCGL